MNNFDYNYDTIGSSALKPRHAAASLSVVEGGRHDARRQCSVREQARRAYDWYVCLLYTSDAADDAFRV